MHSIEELLKQPDLSRSDRLSAAILSSLGNDSPADRARLEELLKGLQFIAATASPAAAPFLKLVFDGMERLSAGSVSEDQRLRQQQKKRQCRSAKRMKSAHLCSPAPRPGMTM